MAGNGKWGPMNESMYFLLKMGDISAIAMLVYWRVVHQDVDPQSVNLGVQVESFRWKTKKNHTSLVANREDDP